MIRRCPHCGNSIPELQQGNGERDSSPDLTLLCIARVKPEEWSFDHVKPEPSDFDAHGLVPCGMQWEPNDASKAVR